MILSIKAQALIFFLAILIGGGIGFFYDLIRVFRRVFKHNNILVQIEDLLYWFTSSIITFLIVLYKNNGEIRGFFILGVFLGMILYFLTISILFIKVSSQVLIFLKKVFILIFKSIYLPIKTVFKIFYYPFNLILKNFYKILKNSLHNGKIYAIIKNNIKLKGENLSEK